MALTCAILDVSLVTVECQLLIIIIVIYMAVALAVEAYSQS